MPVENQSPPVVLTIAGSDCSAGAGLQADLKAIAAFGCYGLSAVTCVVSEVPGKVSRLAPVDPALLADQLRLLLDTFPVKAVKTGLLCSNSHVEATCDILEALGPACPPLVIDPVMVATSGDPLMEKDAVTTYRSRLFPLGTLMTPNLSEATFLLGRPVSTLEEMEPAANELRRLCGLDVLLKGGHLTENEASDVLSYGGGIEIFSAPFTPGVDTHGTGCTYSAAIAANLAAGIELVPSIQRAKAFVSAAIANYHRWSTGGKSVDALNHATDFSPPDPC